MERAIVQRGAVALVVAVSVLVLVACVPRPSSWLGESGYHVGVIGDSLVHNAEVGGGVDVNDPDRFLSQALVDAGFRASVAAAIGAQTADLAPMVPFPEPGVEILVIGMGTNDVRDPSVTVETAISNVVGYIDAHPVPCAALLTIATDLSVTAPAYNAALAQLAAEREDIVLADWAAVLDGHPEYLGEDGVHHSDLGEEAYRSLIVDAAEECAAVIASSATSTTDTTSTTVKG